jgi:hypothetical protein
MTSERAGEGHPSDTELAAWVDDPGREPADLTAHLAGCAGCRDKIASLRAVRAAIALDPPMPSEAEFAAQRERILATIEGAPRERGGRVIRRLGWLVPLAAAAGVAAIVLVERADKPETAPPREEVFAEAEAAAREAAALAVDGEALDAALAASDPLSPPAIERAVAIEDEFALLSETEQSAVLRDLERSDFDL